MFFLTYSPRPSRALPKSQLFPRYGKRAKAVSDRTASPQHSPGNKSFLGFS